MTSPRIASYDQWLAARKDLLAKEKELTRARDAVNAQRRKLPMVPVTKEYVLTGGDGKASLLDLFDGRRQLFVYHMMYAPDWDEACGGCSFLVDSIGRLEHLHAADTTLVVVARAPWDKLRRYWQRMEWTVPFYSSFESDFNYDFHVTLDPAVAPVEYNYQPSDERGDAPGMSVFLREGDRVHHTYSSYARGGDLLLGTFNYLDMTPLGRQEDGGTMYWVKHHDKYTTGELS